MIIRRYIQIESDVRVGSEFEYRGQLEPQAGLELMDVTDRQDGPFIGKIYDAQTDTFSDPPEEEPED